MAEPIFQFRESRPVGQVILLKDGQEVYRSSEYSTTARYAQSRYGLSDGTLMVMYHDYREDYDAI